MLRPVFRGVNRTVFNGVYKRTLISVPEIPYLDQLKDKGIEGLYSSNGLRTAWYDNAEHLLSGLEEVVELAPNRAILISAIESAKAKGPDAQLESLVKKSVATPDSYDAFQIASRVYNSFFAMSSLTPNREGSTIEKPGPLSLLESPSIETDFPNSPADYLGSWITDSFGSIVEFRTLLLGSSLALRGNGYTWLVARATVRGDRATSSSKYDNLFVVNTYNGGTPHFETSSGQLLSLDEQLKLQLEQEKKEKGILEPELVARLPTVEEAKNQTDLLDNYVYLPLLLINGSPHAYLPDYGVFGKRKYLENVWNSIDWQAVTARLPNSNERPKF